MISKQVYNNCLSLILAMFLVFSFLIFFTYFDRYSNASKLPNISENIFEFYYNENFAAHIYSWECQNQKCVKVLAEEVVSFNTCNMLCSEPQLWPKPTNLTLKNKSFSVIDKRKIHFRFSAQNLVQEMLVNVTNIFKDKLNLLQPIDSEDNLLSINVTFTITDLNVTKLSINTDESYQLTVEKKQSIFANITAQCYFGARHALETLFQLIWFDDFTNELRIIHDVYIIDKPKFPYRSVMIDTARNYFPISLIKKAVDGMAMSKLNTLHLHLTDAVSFPIVLPHVKELAFFGSYGPNMIYTPSDIKDLRQYALTRGVRLLLEIDAPSHVNAGWNIAKDNVICAENDFNNGHMNPDNDNVLSLLEKIYTDLLDLSDNNEIFHIGSDEVDLNCWKKTESFKKSKSNNIIQFWKDYTNKMLEKLKNANSGKYPDYVIMWSSPLTESSEIKNFNENVAVQFWLGNLDNLIKANRKIIYSTVGHWYLDCGFGPWKSSMKSGVCDPYTTWHEFYNYRPWIIHGHQDLVLGGEVCLWSEEVEVDTLETRLWPRTAAFAERIWSDLNTSVDTEIYSRLAFFIERLKSLGIKSSGIWPRWCFQNPGKC